jgi:2-keto-4-pentenoate hydratase
MQLSKNGTVVSEGTGADCMGSPLNAMLWLSKKMIELGEPLRAGELILSGALGAMVDVVQGDNINAEIKGLGQVSVSFS